MKKTVDTENGIIAAAPLQTLHQSPEAEAGAELIAQDA